MDIFYNFVSKSKKIVILVNHLIRVFKCNLKTSKSYMCLNDGP